MLEACSFELGVRQRDLLQAAQGREVCQAGVRNHRSAQVELHKSRKARQVPDAQVADLRELQVELAKLLEALQIAQQIVGHARGGPPTVRPGLPVGAPKLKQVLLNLCQNALQAMKHGGTLTGGHASRHREQLIVGQRRCGVQRGRHHLELPLGIEIGQRDLVARLGLRGGERLLDGALESLPMLDIPGKGPTAMFSILKAHTRIPPHTGTTNARTTVHLPLVVPPGCGFRVGAETREWREGEAWAFDDTIEHEAWNDSDQPRAVLILDTWNPALSEPEREMITALTAGVGEYYGELPAYARGAG